MKDFQKSTKLINLEQVGSQLTAIIGDIGRVWKRLYVLNVKLKKIRFKIKCCQMLCQIPWFKVKPDELDID